MLCMCVCEWGIEAQKNVSLLIDRKKIKKKSKSGQVSFKWFFFWREIWKKMMSNNNQHQHNWCNVVWPKIFIIIASKSTNKVFPFVQTMIVNNNMERKYVCYGMVKKKKNIGHQYKYVQQWYHCQFFLFCLMILTLSILSFCCCCCYLSSSWSSFESMLHWIQFIAIWNNEKEKTMNDNEGYSIELILNIMSEEIEWWKKNLTL